MSWTAIAKKDLQDSIRSRTLWATIGIFLGLILLLSWLFTDGSGEETFIAAAGFTFLIGVLFFIPMAGLLLSVKRSEEHTSELQSHPEAGRGRL